MTKISKRINVAILAGIVATSAVLTAPSALADRGGKRGGPKGDRGGEQRLAKMFERMDENSDGVLTLAEMTAKVDAKAEKMLSKKDADEDGVLSLEEFSTNKRGEVRDLSDIADEIVQCVADLKEESGNADIQVPTADSFKSPQARFDGLDSSADGALDLAELQAGGLAKASDRFAKTDADENGEVTIEEFGAAHKAHRATKRAVRQCVHEINDDSEV
jgi:Ca2+-binding EF-hand superfamily protein